MIKLKDCVKPKGITWASDLPSGTIFTKPSDPKKLWLKVEENQKINDIIAISLEGDDFFQFDSEVLEIITDINKITIV